MTRTGYRLVLPPAWTRIPLDDNIARSVDAIIDPKFADLPADSYGPHRTRLRQMLITQAQTARANQGIDLYLPVEQVHGATLTCSFVVAYMPFSTIDVPDPDDVLVAVAAGSDDATLLDLDGAAAVRTEHVVPGRPKADEEHRHPTRRVDYVIAVPDSHDGWLAVSFSALGDGNPEGDITLLLVELFDAIMSTFEWVLEDAPASERQ